MADRFDEILQEMRREHEETLSEMGRHHDGTLSEMRREHDERIEHIDRRQDQTDELIRFLGELNRRGEIALQDLLRATAEMRTDIRASVEMSKETVESAKAHTRAIFALIDRLEGGGLLRPAT